MKFKKIILLSALILLVLTISSVSATNSGTNETISINENNLDNEIIIENNDEIIKENNKEFLQQYDKNSSQTSSNNDNNEELRAPSQKYGWNVRIWTSANMVLKTTFDISDKPITIDVEVKNSNPNFSSAQMQLQNSITYPSGKVIEWKPTLNGAQQVGYESLIFNELGTYTISVKSDGYSLSGTTTYTFKIINQTAEDIKKQQALNSNKPIVYDDEDEDENAEPVKIKAPEITVKLKAKKYFKITIKEKNGAPIKHETAIIKIWSGKKVKKYTLSTNSKGIIKISTKKLKLGTHKVKIYFRETDDYKSKTLYSKIIVKKKLKSVKKTTTKKKKSNNWKQTTIKIKLSNNYGNHKKLKTGDTLNTVYSSRNAQYNKGVYVEVSDYDYPIHTKIKKVKFYFKNKNTGKIITKTAKIKNSKYDSIAKSNLISGYKPIKAKVWYAKR